MKKYNASIKMEKQTSSNSDDSPFCEQIEGMQMYPGSDLYHTLHKGATCFYLCLLCAMRNHCISRPMLFKKNKHYQAQQWSRVIYHDFFLTISDVFLGTCSPSKLQFIWEKKIMKRSLSNTNIQENKDFFSLSQVF